MNEALRKITSPSVANAIEPFKVRPRDQGQMSSAVPARFPERGPLGFQFAAAHISVSHAYVHMVDFGLPVKLGGLWVKPGDLVHADQHGVVASPPEIADRIPEAVAKVEADERKIIDVCKSKDFS